MNYNTTRDGSRERVAVPVVYVSSASVSTLYYGRRFSSSAQRRRTGAAPRPTVRSARQRIGLVVDARRFARESSWVPPVSGRRRMLDDRAGDVIPSESPRRAFGLRYVKIPRVVVRPNDTCLRKRTDNPAVGARAGCRA